MNITCFQVLPMSSVHVHPKDMRMLFCFMSSTAACTNSTRFPLMPCCMWKTQQVNRRLKTAPMFHVQTGFFNLVIIVRVWSVVLHDVDHLELRGSCLKAEAIAGLTVDKVASQADIWYEWKRVLRGKAGLAKRFTLVATEVANYGKWKRDIANYKHCQIPTDRIRWRCSVHPCVQPAICVQPVIPPQLVRQIQWTNGVWKYKIVLVIACCPWFRLHKYNDPKC